MLEHEKLKRTYLMNEVIAWVAIMMASAVILARTLYMAHMLPIFAGGAIWFVVLVAGEFFWHRQIPGYGTTSK